MSRIACVQVPLFPLAARLRAEPEMREEALAVLAGVGHAARVAAATRRARRAGVRPGFTLAQARARLPKLVARPRDAECERAAQEALFDVASAFSPRVEDGGEGIAYLDIEGLARHYDAREPERALARELIRALDARAGLPAWVGVGSSKLTARLAASRGAEPTVVAPGEEGEFLSPVPLDRVTPQASTLTTLERWGLRSLGELAALPAAEVVSRLGPAGEALHAIARGEDPSPLVPRPTPPTFREGLELEWPLVALEPFLFVARAALERLVARLESHALGCRRLELSIDLEPEGHHERSIELPAPTRDVKTLLKLLQLDLEGESPGAPIIGFRLVAHPDRPRGAQLSLFGPEALSPDRLATTLAKLFSILGPERVGSPREVSGHRPERFELVPYEPPPPPPERREPKPGRGLLTVRVLRPPLPVEVMTDQLAAGTVPPSKMPPRKGPDAGGANDLDPAVNHARAYDDATNRPCRERPVSVRSVLADETSKKPKIHGAVKVASGPWGLEEGWWTGEDVGRDYWDVELSTGGLYRLYRDRESGDWFVDGIYD